VDELIAPLEGGISIPITYAASVDEANGDKSGEYLDQLRQLQSEFADYKKRVLRQQTEWHDDSTREIIADVLPILDDFDRLFHFSANESPHVSRAAVSMIYEKMTAVFRKRGLEVIDAKNSPFDPEMHEAVITEESSIVPHGTVLQVWEKGYKLKDKLLRPAKVKVAQNAAERP